MCADDNLSVLVNMMTLINVIEIDAEVSAILESKYKWQNRNFGKNKSSKSQKVVDKTT